MDAERLAEIRARLEAATPVGGVEYWGVTLIGDVPVLTKAEREFLAHALRDCTDLLRDRASAVKGAMEGCAKLVEDYRKDDPETVAAIGLRHKLAALIRTHVARIGEGEDDALANNAAPSGGVMGLLKEARESIQSFCDHCDQMSPQDEALLARIDAAIKGGGDDA